MAADPEKAARLSIDLGRPGEPGYDQIVAISQGMLNDGFDDMHRCHPRLRQCSFETTAGNINAELMPPRVLIPNDEAKKDLYWLLRFQSGLFTRKTGQVDEQHDMQGWTIAFKIALGPLDSHAPGTNVKPTQYDRIAGRFKSSGRYSVGRLYAVLADAFWFDGNIDFAKSSITDRHNVAVAPPAQTGGNPFLLKAVTDVFRLIAKAKREASSSTVSPESVFQDKEIAPLFSIYQHHSYKLAGLCPEGTEGLSDQASRNCLLFGKLKDKGQSTSSIRHSGNFSPGPGKGTWALNSSFMLNPALLSKLQTALYDMQVRPLKPNYTHHDHHTTIDLQLDVGYSGVDDKDTDEAYTLKYDPKSEKWRGGRKHSMVDVQSHPTVSNWHLIFRGSALTEILVSPWPETDYLYVEGECHYYMSVCSVDQGKVGGELLGEPTVVGLMRASYKYGWNFELAVTPSSGTLVFKPRPDSSNIWRENHLEDKVNKWDSMHEYKAFQPIIDAIEYRLNWCAGQLKYEFSRENCDANMALKAICAEHGSHLDFSNPIVTETRDLLVETTYRKMPAEPEAPVVTSHALFKDRKVVADD